MGGPGNFASQHGMAGGVNGTGIKGPANADIQRPVTNADADYAMDRSKAALDQQLAFLQAVQGQNGIQNQTDTYNQFQGIVNGTGANPAQAMLNNATGQNVSNQAALMAGQRGASANTGLMARQAAQQGANTQQQAAGQGAAMQAQQSLNALGSAAGIAGTQAQNQANATNAFQQGTLGYQNSLFGNQAAGNQAAVGMQSNVNNINGALAGGVMDSQQKHDQGAMNMMGSMFGGMSDKNSKTNIKDAKPEVQDFLDSVGSPKKYEYKDSKKDHPMAGEGEHISPMAQDLEKTSMGKGMVKDTPDGKIVDYAKGFGAMLAAQGEINERLKALEGKGSPKKLAMGGELGSVLGPAMLKDETAGGPGGGAGASDKGKGIKKPSMPKDEEPVVPFMQHYGSLVTQTPQFAQGGNVRKPFAERYMNFAKGGQVPALVSPGEQYLKPEDVHKVKQGANPLEVGEKIPGKPKVGGAKNDYANDTVSKTLEEGGVVLPRSVTQSKDPAAKAAAFVEAIFAKKRLPSRNK